MQHQAGGRAVAVGDDLSPGGDLRLDVQRVRWQDSGAQPQVGLNARADIFVQRQGPAEEFGDGGPGEVVPRRPQAAHHEHDVGAAAEGQGPQDGLLVVRYTVFFAECQSDLRQAIAKKGQVRVDGIARQQLVAYTDDADVHTLAILPVYGE